MKNELFVNAGEVAQKLGVSKPFVYKLVRQMNEELEKKGLSQSSDVSAANTMKKNSMAWRRRRTKEGEENTRDVVQIKNNLAAFEYPTKQIK